MFKLQTDYREAAKNILTNAKDASYCVRNDAERAIVFQHAEVAFYALITVCLGDTRVTSNDLIVLQRMRTMVHRAAFLAKMADLGWSNKL